MSYIWPWPKGTSINQPFGSSPGGVNPAGGHTGCDGGTPPNTPIVAPADGVIEYAQWFTTDNGSDNPYWITNGGGITVVLGCDGATSPSFVFSHLNSTDKNRGDRVKQGDIIGYSGNTGKWTTGPHTHFEAIPPGFNLYSNTFGRVNPAIYCTSFKGSGAPATSAPVVVAGNQRRVGTDSVNQRAEPNTSSKIVRVIEGNTTETFTGFVFGATVSGNNTWYKDDAGYAWSGGFESQSTAGLPNVTPKAPAPAPKPTPKANERLVGSDNVNQRSGASTSSPVLRVIDAGTIEAFTGYVYGETVAGNNLWYKDASGYVWSGGFVSQATTGLPNQTPTKPTEIPATAPSVTPTAPTKYSFKPDFDFVEYKPVDYENVMDRATVGKEVFPAKPQKVVIHQFGTLGVDTLQSTINTFTNPTSQVSAHFVVSGTRIVQMVSLQDRAFHAYTVGNDYIGIETDPAQDSATIESTKKLLRALKAKYGYTVAPVLHRDVPMCSTNCGAAIDLKKYSIDTDAAPAPKPTVPPVVPAPEVPKNTATEREVLMAFVSDLVDGYLAKK